MGKLGSKLRTELKRNSKKSAILGIVVLVALYFWAPLFRKMLGSPKSAAILPTVVQATTLESAALTPVDAMSSPTPVRETNHGWSTLANWMEMDRHMQSVSLADAFQNPFAEHGRPLGSSAQQVANDASIADLETVDDIELDGAKLGLVLHGTIVGRRKRLATINGLTYEEGAPVELAASAGQPANEEPTPAVLSEVNRGYVLLRHKNQIFRLEIKAPKLNSGSHVVAH